MTSTHVYHHEKNYSVQATSTTTHLTPLHDTLPIPSVKLHTTTELPPSGKEYLCFQINGRYSHADQCVKYRIPDKAIDSILSIDTFKQQCIVLKFMLQSPHLEDNMKTIGIDQSLINRPSDEHKCLNNIKKINMLVNVMTNKTSTIFFMMLCFLLHMKSLMSVLFCV